MKGDSKKNKSHPKRASKTKTLFKVEYIVYNPSPNDVPDEKLLVVGVKNKYAKWAYMKCPSGCGDILMLSLQKGDNPRWRLSVDKNDLPSLYPSVWKMDGCRSHFLLRRGTVVVVKRMID
jgi:hypothetical protein